MLVLDIFYPVDVNRETLSVNLVADISIVNDGIGAYEYWGFRGYDEGQTYIKADNIRWQRDMYNDEENEAISKVIDTYEVQEAFGEDYKKLLELSI